MDEFIQSVTSQLGIDESTAKNATGTALGFLKNGLGDQFSAVAEKLPGAEDLISSAAPAESSDGGGGGLLDSIKGAASSMLGGGAGEGIELMGALQNTGLSTEQGGSFITMLIEFIKGKVGDGVMAQITDKIPMLKTLVG
ncbi:MAG: DUF2780 domain-containing protein [Pirellulaceae bacterium]